MLVPTGQGFIPLTLQDQLNNYYLCSNPDDPILEDKAIWVVQIQQFNIDRNDDVWPVFKPVTVYQNDGVVDAEPVAWRRLAIFLKDHPYFRIDSMSLKFRSNVVEIGANARGYYFSYGAGRDSSDNHTDDFYVCGTVDQTTVHCKWYKIPELLVTREYTKPISDAFLPKYIMRPY